MAHYHWQEARTTYKLTNTISKGGEQIELSEYSKQKARINDLLAATSELETAARTGIAPNESILG